MSVCQLCATEPREHVLELDTMNGRAVNYLCSPCVASTLGRNGQYRTRPELNGQKMDTEEIKALLPKNRKCVTCGTKCTGGHWHFASTELSGKAVKGGRVYYCGVQCCALCEGRGDWEDDWEDDEFVFGDDEDEFVFE